ncbi:hypothetical protein [Catellatospora sp. NPDC049133]|uniref:hypothetical protein n=1 Tax=Catellatospora sp. NPDC049133 TaxID=3155499 RepID=UPI0033D473AD
MDSEDDRRWQRTAAIAGGVVGGLAGTAIEPALGAPAAVFGAVLAEKLIEDQVDRIRRFLASTRAENGMTTDELEDVLTNDDAKRGLLAHVLTVASGSRADIKVTLLAKVFARAVASPDGTVVDRAALAIDTVAQLDAPHIEVLSTMASQLDEPGGVTAWDEHQLTQANPGHKGVQRPLLRRLESLGLIEDQVTGLGGEDTRHLSRWVFTSFGAEIVVFLRGKSLEFEGPTAGETAERGEREPSSWR